MVRESNYGNMSVVAAPHKPRQTESRDPQPHFLIPVSGMSEIKAASALWPTKHTPKEELWKERNQTDFYTM